VLFTGGVSLRDVGKRHSRHEKSEGNRSQLVWSIMHKKAEPKDKGDYKEINESLHEVGAFR